MENVVNKRDKSIDRFRGLLVFSMVFFQILSRFNNVGILSRLASHDSVTGITLFGNLKLADIIAPAFFFCIGLNYIPSLRRRIEKDGRKKAYFHFIVRYLCIIGAGYALDFTEKVLDWWTQEPLFYFTFIIEVLMLGALLVFLVFKLLKKNTKFLLSFIKATLCIIGINCLIVSVIFCYSNFYLGTYFSSWNALQSIGAAGLLMLLIAEAPTLARFISSIVIFLYFTFFHNLPNNMELIDRETQGGLIGALGWLVMLIVATCMADLYYKDKKENKHYFDISLLVLSPIAIIGALTMYINKGSVSPGYILVSLFISPFGFRVITLFDKLNIKYDFLSWWGISPILMYLCQFLFNNVLFTFVEALADLSFAPSILLTLVLTSLFTYIAYKSYKNSIVKF